MNIWERDWLQRACISDARCNRNRSRGFQSIWFLESNEKSEPLEGSACLDSSLFLRDYCGGVLLPFEGGGGVLVPGLLGVVVPGFVLPGLEPELGAVLLGVPPGVVDPGAAGLCGVVSGTLPGWVALPAGGVAVPAGGVAVLPGGVAALPGGVAVLPGGVAVPPGAVVEPGVELWPADPEPPAGAVPPEGELCAITQLAQHRITENNVSFVIDIFSTSASGALVNVPDCNIAACQPSEWLQYVVVGEYRSIRLKQ
jgi:hypothetical protein